MLGIYWEMEREGVQQVEVEVECRPQWVSWLAFYFQKLFIFQDGVTACVPSTTVNQLAILPCIEHYDGQFFDTKCEYSPKFHCCYEAMN